MSFFEDIKKPANWIGYLIGIIGIVLSIAFYFYTQKSRNVTYQINASSLIYDSKNSSSTIKLLEKDSVPITDNVYLLTGTIWNNGDLPIDNKDVRVPLCFNLHHANRILDYGITRQKDSAVAKFTLNRISDLSLRINWEYFDPKNGFNFQIIYIGNLDPGFNISGKVLDVKQITNVPVTEKIAKWKQALLIGGIIFMLLLSIFLASYEKKQGKITITSYALVILNILLLIYSLLHFFWDDNENMF